MDGCAFRRNCSSSSALHLAATVIRDAANCSVEKRERKRCPRRGFHGDVVALEIPRDGQADQFPVAVSERCDLSGLSDPVDAREHMVARFGILGLNLTDQIRHMLPAVRVATGVVVASTGAGAIDSRDGGFAPGDVIYAINRVPVSGLGELRALLETLRIGDPIVVQLQRRGELMYLAFTLE